jgi:hypothetical protein
MTERLRTTLLITAIVVASAFVTVTTWAGLRIITSGATMQQRSATITVPGPPVHGRFSLPPVQAKLLPFYRHAGAVPAMPVAPKR